MRTGCAGRTANARPPERPWPHLCDTAREAGNLRARGCPAPSDSVLNLGRSYELVGYPPRPSPRWGSARINSSADWTARRGGLRSALRDERKPWPRVGLKGDLEPRLREFLRAVFESILDEERTVLRESAEVFMNPPAAESPAEGFCRRTGRAGETTELTTIGASWKRASGIPSPRLGFDRRFAGERP